MTRFPKICAQAVSPSITDTVPRFQRVSMRLNCLLVATQLALDPRAVFGFSKEALYPSGQDDAVPAPRLDLERP